jgi:hypothetical protein
MMTKTILSLIAALGLSTLLGLSFLKADKAAQVREIKQEIPSIQHPKPPKKPARTVRERVGTSQPIPKHESRQYKSPLPATYAPTTHNDANIPDDVSELPLSKTYTNVDAITVPRPRHQALEIQQATAICRDGTYSYSRHRQGTCSRHGGVSTWLILLKN